MAEEVKPLETVVRNWAIVTIDKFQESLVRMDIGELDGPLMRSFVAELEVHGNDSMTVLLKFLACGRFVDMGVGRGHPLGTTSYTTSQNGNRYSKPNSRQPKKWYGKTKTKSAYILAFIIKKNYSHVALKMLETQLKSTPYS